VDPSIAGLIFEILAFSPAFGASLNAHLGIAEKKNITVHLSPGGYRA